MRSFKKFKLIFGIVFSIPLVVWFFLLVSFIKNDNILKYGTETDAEVIRYESNVTVNDVPMYKLFYRFFDADGNSHTGETSSDYTLEQAQEMTTIKIKYNKNYESIQVDYKNSDHIELFLLPIFGLVGVGFLIAFFVEVKNSKLDKIARNLGTRKNATLVTSGSNIMINEVPYFYLVFKYKDNYGNIKQKKTHSRYTYDEKRFFEMLHEFEIAEYRGHVAVIQTIDISKLYQKEKQQLPENKFKTCKYCESTISMSDKKCPNCGSNEFKF